ncbi:MAG: toxin-activating lysine-acyltransferase [Rhodospirillaceae bacterium]|jgi:cytolysin-activating lysine-acyltransferase|nr:toxin-activating lysine-acyltransferase [Rhodospirillales bacterium]MBT3907928.1 toxin-activating lysine-acyltransferase [Rhodospirillaceae bacterium]MBT4700778.1 toxin-activating lysine-acyltransferase [Rhodospirillaceae bacterium]MBT5035261.1 toxin-activating lysine-acyltransferase [Rhodospirillaceae bacterium]MBT6218223.1 toxin-activating lysine-acyltransferase [Rhodospirillaceae bacterium]
MTEGMAANNGGVSVAGKRASGQAPAKSVGKKKSRKAPTKATNHGKTGGGKTGAKTKTAGQAPRKPTAAKPEVMAQPVAAQVEQPASRQPSPTEVLGQVVGLMCQSPLHKHFFMADLEWLVMPAIMTQQFRLFRKDGRPIAYASWAYLGKDAAERLTQGARKIKPDEWKTDGGELWLIDLVAPLGGNEVILKELREKVFKGEKVKTLQPAPDGDGLAVVEW